MEIIYTGWFFPEAVQVKHLVDTVALPQLGIEPANFEFQAVPEPV